MTDITLQSDEDFMNGMDAALESLAANKEDSSQNAGQDETSESESSSADVVEPVIENADADANLEGNEPNQDDDDALGDKEGAAAAAASEETGKAKPDQPINADKSKDEPAEGAEVVVDADEPLNYENLYKQVTAPFKANGKQFEIRSPEEAVKLMQLGANYGKKMQELRPAKKAVAMLENAGLLGNEADLSLLISVRNGDKEAIKKLLKDKNVDPFDLDMNVEPQYAGPVHTVTDSEVAFRTQLDDVVSQEGGQETIQTLETVLDPKSRQEVWNDPTILSSLHEARVNGTYQVITDEIDRRKTLGQISPDTPFLQAYVAVGQELSNQRTNSPQPLGQMETRQPANPTGMQAVATRPAAPRPEVKHSEQARSAAAAQSRPTPARVVKNPLALSDEEFLKSFGNLEFG